MRSGRLSVSMDVMAEGGAGAETGADKEDGQVRIDLLVARVVFLVFFWCFLGVYWCC